MPVAWACVRVGVEGGRAVSSVGDPDTTGVVPGVPAVPVPEGTHRADPAKIVFRSRQLASFRAFTPSPCFEASPERLSPHLMRYSTQPGGVSQKEAGIAAVAAGDIVGSSVGDCTACAGAGATVGLFDVMTI